MKIDIFFMIFEAEAILCFTLQKITCTGMDEACEDEKYLRSLWKILPSLLTLLVYRYKQKQSESILNGLFMSKR